jgi:transcriptional regulator with XRE-family HTH domain
MRAHGDEIRRQRRDSGRNLRTFAKEVGTSPSWLSRIETNKATPSPDLLKRIAVALQKAAGDRAAIAKIARPEEGSDEHQAPGDR